MRLNALFLFVCVSQVWAGLSYAQQTKLTLKMDNARVIDVLDEIENNSEFYFLFNQKLVDVERKVDLNVEGRTIDKILSDVFSNTEVKHQVKDRLIILTTEKSGFSSVAQNMDQQNSISGKIIDNAGEPLPGVTVVLKGTTQGTISDMDGNFNLPNVKAEDVLVFSFVGMVTQEITVGNQSEINVTMMADAIGLEEVVAIGYGTVRKSDLTGSVGSVDTKELEYESNSRIDHMLQGRTPGVQITQTDGAPGAATVVRVRGGNSIEGNNEPLWVIDGIIVGQEFNLNNINPNDIKSIEVLKDASSVAIYGSRGANGVMLVTTKAGTGVAGEPKVNLSLSRGIQTPPYEAEYVNGIQQAEYVNEDARFRGVAEPYPDMSKVSDTHYYDLLLQNAPLTNFDASITGRSKEGKVNYYISANYFDQDGIIKNTGIKKYIYRTNLDITLSPKVKIGTRVNFSRLERDNGTVSYSSILTTPRSIPVYNEDGTYNGYNDIVGGPGRNLVFDAENNINETYTNNFLGTFYLEYKPSEAWLIKTTLNPEVNNVKNNKFISSQSPDRLFLGEGGEAHVSSLSSVGWNNENTVLYTPNLNEDHNLSVLGGITFQKYSAESHLSEAYGITTDATKFNNLTLASDPTRNVVGSGYDAFQLVSFLGRLNYSYRDKYLVTFVGRSDGSSRFAPGNKFAFFPSGALAWNLEKEPFIENLGVFEGLKLRASYGKSGSQAIESFRTLATMIDASSSSNGVPVSGSTVGRPENPNLTWETTRQLDIGLEMSFFKGRLTTEFDYYHKNTTDLLLNVQIPRGTGFETQLKNLGEVENKGLEFMLNSVNISKSDFNWNTSVTISGNRNKVLDLAGPDYINRVSPNATQGVAGRLEVGQPAPVFVGYTYVGTWKSQEEIDASGRALQVVGGPHFKDFNGDGKLGEEDKMILGSPQPDFIFGFNNSVQYKNWDFSCYFQGTYGNEVYNTHRSGAWFALPSTANYLETVDRWTPDNQDSDVPRAGSQALLGTPNNSMDVEDGSHIRLKSLSVAYHLAPEKIGLKGFDDITLYVNGSNLAIWSNYFYKDPESSRYGLDNIAQGFSAAEYPAPRTITIGIRTTF